MLSKVQLSSSLSKFVLHLSFFFCHLFGSLESDHIQVVEWHVMSVTAKHVHVASGINDSRVAITGSWACTFNEAGLLWTSFLVQGFLSLQFGDQFAVNFEAFISVLDDERVLHAHGGGAAQLALLIAAVGFI